MTEKTDYIISIVNSNDDVYDRIVLPAPSKEAAKEIFDYRYDGYKVTLVTSEGSPAWEISFGENRAEASKRAREKVEDYDIIQNIDHLDVPYEIVIDEPKPPVLPDHRPGAFDLLGYAKSNLPEDVEWDDMSHKLQQQVKIANKTVLEYINAQSESESES
jgi:hypothetical protein